MFVQVFSYILYWFSALGTPRHSWARVPASGEVLPAEIVASARGSRFSLPQLRLGVITDRTSVRGQREL